MATFAAYTRVSQVGDRGERLLSPDMQLGEIKRWATAYGHELVVLEPELNESGGREDRRIFQAAIEACERDEYDGIVVAQLDRFSRSTMGALREIKRIEAAGGQLVAVRENIDPTTPTGAKVRRDFFSNAEWERDVKRDQLADSRRRAVAHKIHVSGKVPLGYRRPEDRILVPDPVTAPLVRNIFLRRAAGESWPAIARAASEALGRPIQPQSVARMVRNRVYLGEARNGQYVNPEAHEALVDRATFEAAQLAHPRPPRRKTGPALLAGIVRCAGCGRLMAPTTRIGGVRAYRCRRHHEAGECPEPCHVGQWIDGYVEDTVRALMKGRGYKASQVNRRLADAERELAALEAELEGFQTNVQRIEPQYVASGIRVRVEAVKAGRRRFAEARAAAVPVPNVRSFGAAWESLSGEQRRHVLRASLGAVVVAKGRGVDPARVRILEPGAVVAEDEPVDFDRLEGVVVGS